MLVMLRLELSVERKLRLPCPSLLLLLFRGILTLGRLVRCILPLGSGRLMHLVVACGFQRADDDPEMSSLADQLFDAALCELAVVSRGQRCHCWRFQRGTHQSLLPVERDLGWALGCFARCLGSGGWGCAWCHLQA